GVVGGVRVYSDSAPLVRFLQREIEYLLYKPFGDAGLPILTATFDREGTPPGGCSEIVRSGGGEIRLSWSEFLEPFNFAADPGYGGRPLGFQATFFPAARGLAPAGDRTAEGDPWRMERGGKPCTSACLAWCETWFRPR